MARVLRTNILPKQSVLHECRDARGKRVQRHGLSGTRCPACGTHLVYVFDNTPKKPRRQ